MRRPASPSATPDLVAAVSPRRTRAAAAATRPGIKAAEGKSLSRASRELWEITIPRSSGTVQCVRPVTAAGRGKAGLRPDSPDLTIRDRKSVDFGPVTAEVFGGKAGPGPILAKIEQNQAILLDFGIFAGILKVENHCANFRLVLFIFDIFVKNDKKWEILLEGFSIVY